MTDEELLEAVERECGISRALAASVLEVFRREQVAPVDIDGCAVCGFHCTHDALINAAYQQGLAAARREQGTRDEALREALGQERAQFQRETLRTSELHRMLERAGSYIRDVDGPDSPLARAFAREILELLAKPINAAAPATEEVE